MSNDIERPFARFRRRCETIDSVLCVGLDPRISIDRNSALGEPADLHTRRGKLLFTVDARNRESQRILEQNLRLIDATLPFTAAYKPNIAFYEALGPEGIIALLRTLDAIPDDVPVILDMKRGDIGSTADAYADAAEHVYGVDALTVSPYMGHDSVLPFLENRRLHVFVLCRTSNPGAADLQHLIVQANGEYPELGEFPLHGGDATNTVGEESLPLYLQVADHAVRWSPRIGLVVGATEPQVVAIVRDRLPQTWLLTPGIGAQGASAEETAALAADHDGFGVSAVVARAIAAADDPRAAAGRYRDELNRGRSLPWHQRCALRAVHSGAAGRQTAGRQSTPAPAAPTLSAIPPAATASAAATAEAADALSQRLLKGLITVGCFRLGAFTLKSGLVSPFYVDLRRIISRPDVLSDAADAYATLAGGLQFDRVAGIPLAGLPLATAFALRAEVPMVFPRMQAKSHGTGNLVEGEFAPGDRVLLLDDLITTGASKIEAIAVMREAGLIVEDLVVLLERGAGARQELAQAGVRLHAFADVRDFFPVCRSLGLLDDRQLAELVAFVDRRDA